MRKYLLILSMCLAFNSFAQTTKIDKNTVVKDANGSVVPYILWSRLAQSGEYSLKQVTGTSEFTLYQLTAEEKLKITERKKTNAVTMAKPRTSDAFKEGDKFKGEKMTDINGNKFDLKNTAGKIYVINFWFINCPPCKQEIPELNELVEQYKENKDVIFIAIALDQQHELKNFLKIRPFNYNVIDDGRYYATKYGVTAYPTHVIVGKDGLIKFSTVGLASNTVHWIEKTIKEQLGGI